MTSRSWPVVLAAVAVVVLRAGETAGGAELPAFEPGRAIYVPEAELPALLELPTQRVLLSAEEYEQLARQARRRPDKPPPRLAALLSADIRIELEGSRARVSGELELEVLAEGLHALVLELEGVGLRAAWLDGQPARLGRSKGGPWMLFVERRGLHSLRLEMLTPVETTASQQLLRFRLPRPPAARLRLVAPGDVEVRKGAAVVGRVVDEAVGLTRMELVPVEGPVELALSLNSRLRQQQRLVLARSVLIDEVTQAYERLHAAFALSVLHQATDRFRFVLPEGFEASHVESVQLARWAEVEEGGRRILEVVLRQAVTERVVVQVTAIRAGAAAGSWTLARIEPLEAVGQTSVVGLLVDQRLAVESIEPTGLLPIDTDILGRALPAAVERTEPGAPSIRPVVAYYAPDATFALAARLRTPPVTLRATTNVLLSLSDKGLALRGGFALAVEAETIHDVTILLPGQWRPQSVRTDAGKALAFEHDAPAGQPARLRVRIPGGVARGAVQTIYFDATWTPQGWLSDWAAQELALPEVRLLEATSASGAIAVAVADDLLVRPQALENLTPLGEAEKPRYGLAGVATQLAYRHETAEYRATLVAERLAPRTTARVFNFLNVERGALSAHYELAYAIERAAARRLVFSLPADTPADVAIRGLDDVALKEYQAELVDGRRRWNVLLAEARKGVVRLVLSFDAPLEDPPPGELLLPLVRAEEVEYQSGLVGVEGSPDYLIRVARAPRRVDIGALAEADYLPGRRLLAALAYAGDEAEVALEVSRPGDYPLQAAIVEQASYATMLSSNGLSQTSAEFKLRAKLSYVEARLPEGSTLWSVLVSGTPAKPQRTGNRLLVSLPADQVAGLHTLVLHYETPLDAAAHFGRVAIGAARLYYPTKDQAPPIEVPVADLRWELYLPSGYRVLWSGGTLARTDQVAHRLAATRVAEAMYLAAGGIGGGALFGHRGADAVAFSTGGAGFGDPLRESSTPFADQSPSAGLAGRGAFSADLEVIAAGPESVLTGKPQSEPVPLPPTTAPARPQGRLAGAVAAAPDNRLAELAGAKAELAKSAAAGKLAGFRSLVIELARSDNRASFQSLGADPALDVTLVDGRRVDALAWAVALGVGLYGLVLTRRSWAVRLRYVFAVALVATLVPLAAGWLELTEVANPTFYIACLLLPYYAVAGVCRRLAARCCRRRPLAALAAVCVCGVLMAAGQMAAQAQGPAPVKLPVVVELDEPAPPVKLPDDALIWLYSGPAEQVEPAAEQVLVPFERYKELYRQAYPEKYAAERPLPADHAPAGGALTARLSAADELRFDGYLDFDVFAEGHVEIPLPMSGAVLVHAVVDGRPASIRAVVPQAPTAEASRAMPAEQAARVGGVARPVPAEPLLVLHVVGKGRHRLELGIRLPLLRQGGWRVVRGRLPDRGAVSLALSCAEADTQVRLRGFADAADWQPTRADEVLQTALAGGPIEIQWRPSVDPGQIDETLKARSEAVLHVQEDGLRLAWTVQLAFERGQRDSFTLSAPEGWLVERVAGDNVRTWQRHQRDQRQQLHVTLLASTAAGEQITVELARRRRLADDGETFDVPQVLVEGAALHTGRMAIVRSAVIDLQTVEARGASRDDWPEGAALGSADASPLGLRPYEHYRFAAAPYVLRLRAAPLAAEVAAEVETVLRLGDRQRGLESRVTLAVARRAIHRARIMLPEGFRPEHVAAPGQFEWVLTDEPQRRLLTVYFHAGQLGRAAIVVSGPLGQLGPIETLPLPRLEVLDVERQQGEIVVQADPAFDVELRDLLNCQPVLLEQVGAWLSPAQRPSARAALRYHTPDYSGTVAVAVRQAVVESQVVANVRVTDRAIEETVLVDLAIRDAGIRQVAIVLPAWMRDARVDVPLLGQKTVESTGEAADAPVRIRLELQDDVMGQLRVLVRHDRLPTPGVQEAPIPLVETGRTLARYITLESSASDEVVVQQAVGLEPIVRQQQQWQTIARLVEGGLTEAYRVDPDAAAPRMTYATLQRAAVETVGARIGLAQTELVVDEHGAYRGVQSWRLYNATEQFLEIALPEGAALWTAWVAGEPVRPQQAAGPATSRHVRLPLIKTAEGDLDYQVAVSYGGTLGELSLARRLTFPVIRTVNINVELSQVRLLLPETYRWVNLGRKMRLVEDEGYLRAGELAYLTTTTRRIMSTLEGKDRFAKARAQVSLSRLDDAAQTYRRQADEYLDNRLVQQELEANQAALALAQQQAAGPQEELAAGLRSNTSYLAEQFIQQGNRRARNVVNELDTNFDVPQDAARPAEGVQSGGFSVRWLADNELGVVEPRLEREDRQADQRKKQDAAESKAPATAAGPLPGQSPAAPQLGSSAGGGRAAQPPQPADMPAQQDAVERYQWRLEQQVRGRDAGPGDVKVDVGQVSVFGAAGAALAAEIPSGGLGESLASRGGLVSLDVTIPRRGQEWLFTTPRGDAEITMQAVSDRLLVNLARLALVIAVGLVLLSAGRWLPRLGRMVYRPLGAIVLTALGLAGMLCWVLPLLSAVVFVAGLVLLVVVVVAARRRRLAC